MKHGVGRAVIHKTAGLLTAGALLFTELMGVCMPVTVMAQESEESLVLDEATTDELVSSGDMEADGIVKDESEEITQDGITVDDDQEETDPDTNIFGNDPATKAQYYVTFTVKNNGKQKSWTKELEKGSEKALNEYEFYESLMTEIRGFVQGEDYRAALIGWSVYTDGFNISTGYSGNITTTYLNADGYTYDTYDQETYEPCSKVFKLDGTKDYHFTAHIAKTETGTLCVSAIPSVYYNGRAHVAIGNKFSPKKEAADLRINVFLGSLEEEYSYKVLEPGKDYTLSYSNNVNASMKLVREGENGEPGSYVSLYADNDPKRPKVTITGKGDYKGFSAEAYFDIMPMNLGADEWQFTCMNQLNGSDDTAYNVPATYTNELYADITGFGNSYLLSGGKVNGIPKQKVTKTFYTTGYDSKGNESVKSTESVQTLTEGKDYKAEIYKWNTEKICWNNTGLSDPSKITEEGDYLYLVRGCGNYCGAVFGYWGSPNNGMGNADRFNTGEDGSKPMPERMIGNSHQFRVTTKDEMDLGKAKVTVKNKTLEYKGKAYGAEDFGISVKSKSGQELVLGRDYTVYFNPQYDHVKATEGVHYGSTVSAANEYRVTINPKGEYYGVNKTAIVKIKGIQFKPKYCTLTSKQKKVPYGQKTTWSLVKGRGIPAFVADGMEPAGTYADDPMYICAVVSTSEVYTASKVDIYVAGSGRCGDAIDPSKGATLTYTHTAIKLQDAVKSGMLGFTLGEAYYSVKGAVPETLGVMVNGETRESFSSLYDPLYSGRKARVYINNVGSTELTFAMKKNTKVNETATLNVKATGVVTGSADFAYNVKPKKVESIGNSYMHSLLSISPDGVLISSPVYAQEGKGDLNKPQIKILQSYTDAKGQGLAEIPSSMYKIVKGDPIGTSGIATKLKVVNVPGSPFDFGDGIDITDNFALYKSTINAKDIVSVKARVFTYEVKNGVITNSDNSSFASYEGIFTGEQIRPDIRKITLKDGTELNAPADFRISYGKNTKVGKGAGTVTFVFNYNTGTDTFKYGGEATLKFDIIDAPKITM